MKNFQFEKFEIETIGNHRLIDKYLKEYLFDMTGEDYCVAVTSCRQWGEGVETEYQMENDKEPFYQIMPTGAETDFFNWYCYHREYNQFFKTKEMCVLYFIYYFNYWLKRGKPKPF